MQGSLLKHRRRGFSSTARRVYLTTPSFIVSLPNRLRKWPRCNLLQSTNEVADTLNPTSSFPTLVRGGSRPDQKPWSALGQSQHCSASLKPHCATQPTVAPPTLFSLFDFYCAQSTVHKKHHFASACSEQGSSGWLS